MRSGKLVLAAVFGVGALSIGQAAHAARVNDIVNAVAAGQSSLVGFDDDDAASLLDNNTNGILDVGDVVRGVIKIQRIFRLFPPGASVDIPQGGIHSEMTGLYQLRVAPGTVGSSYVFEPDPAFAAELTGLGLAGSTTGAMVAFWDDTSPEFSFTLATEGAVRGVASDGDLWGVFGFTGAAGAPAHAGEFFTTTTLSTSIASAIAAPAQGVGIGAFGTGGFSLSQITGPGGLYDALDTLPNGFGTDLAGSYSLHGKDGDPVTAGTQHIYPAFDVTSDADISININAIPLPASAWMGLGLLSAMGAFRSIRRAMRS
jgi:hypothetical protein